MKLLIDQDQVICQWTERVIEWFNADYGANVKREDVTHWNLSEFLGPQGRDFMRSCMRWPEFYTRLDEVEGAVEGIKTLMDAGHEIRIVTAVPKSAGIAYHGKQQWIRDHMPFFDLDNFFAVQKKNEIKGDLLLDDGAHNIEAVKKDGEMLAVVFDTPWNQDVEGDYRVKDWKQFVTLVELLESKRRFQDFLVDVQAKKI